MSEVEPYQLWVWKCLKCEKEFNTKEVDGVKSCPNCGYDTFNLKVFEAKDKNG